MVIRQHMIPIAMGLYQWKLRCFPRCFTIVPVKVGAATRIAGKRNSIIKEVHHRVKTIYKL